MKNKVPRCVAPAISANGCAHPGRGSREQSLRAASESGSAEAGGAGTDKFVAIQIGGRSFVDEGVEACLHTLQEKAAINVVMGEHSILGGQAAFMACCLGVCDRKSGYQRRKVSSQSSLSTRVRT
jgi:hypothetical protein